MKSWKLWSPQTFEFLLKIIHYVIVSSYFHVKNVKNVHFISQIQKTSPEIRSLAIFKLEIDDPSETDNPASKSVKIDRKTDG